MNKLKNSIETFGLVDPIIINLDNNTIIGGHQRYKALNKLGIESLNLIKLGGIGWCFVNDNIAKLDENYEKALNISLNKTSLFISQYVPFPSTKPETSRLLIKSSRRHLQRPEHIKTR